MLKSVPFRMSCQATKAPPAMSVVIPGASCRLGEVHTGRLVLEPVGQSAEATKGSESMRHAANVATAAGGTRDRIRTLLDAPSRAAPLVLRGSHAARVGRIERSRSCSDDRPGSTPVQERTGSSRSTFTQFGRS